MHHQKRNNTQTPVAGALQRMGMPMGGNPQASHLMPMNINMRPTPSHSLHQQNPYTHIQPQRNGLSQNVPTAAQAHMHHQGPLQPGSKPKRVYWQQPQAYPPPPARLPFGQSFHRYFGEQVPPYQKKPKRIPSLVNETDSSEEKKMQSSGKYNRPMVQKPQSRVANSEEMIEDETSSSLPKKILQNPNRITSNLSTTASNNVKVADKGNNEEQNLLLDNKENESDLNLSTEETERADTVQGEIKPQKTAMCLINELARYNKIDHQYRLVNERGPAHSKEFTVKLKLGEEEYVAEGPQIKKAQHAAAEQAIRNTKYKQPLEKNKRKANENSSGTNITPTVKLNALAMKMGLEVHYISDSKDEVVNEDRFGSAQFGGMYSRRPPYNGGHYGPPTRYPGVPYYGNIYDPRNIRYPPPVHQNLSQNPIKITLVVGQKKYIGVGQTTQLAKHNAAGQAVRILEQEFENNKSENENNNSGDDDDIKSPISHVFEISMRRNMTVTFKVLSEDGPAHLKSFVTACTVGSITTKGEGLSKKASKKKAASKMLLELKKLPPMSPKLSEKEKQKKNKTPHNNAERRQRPNRRREPEAYEPAIEMDPVTNLIQFLQLNKFSLPTFNLIGKDEKGRRDFVYEASAVGLIQRGTGKSKKFAKQNAAKKLSEAIELNKEVIMASGGQYRDESAETANELGMNSTNSVAAEAVTPAKDVISGCNNKPVISSTHSSTVPQNKTNTVSSPTASNHNVGVLLVGQSKKHGKKKEEKDGTLDSKSNTYTVESEVNQTTDVAASASKVNTTATTESAMPVVKPKTKNTEHLLYLAKLVGFEVEFSDWPKGVHPSYLSIVTVSTTPPQICHGTGSNFEESRNEAAKNALEILSALRLYNTDDKN